MQTQFRARRPQLGLRLTFPFVYATLVDLCSPTSAILQVVLDQFLCLFLHICRRTQINVQKTPPYDIINQTLVPLQFYQQIRKPCNEIKIISQVTGVISYKLVISYKGSASEYAFNGTPHHFATVRSRITRYLRRNSIRLF